MLVYLPSPRAAQLSSWFFNKLSKEFFNRLIFLRDEHGTRAVFGASTTFQNDAHWRDYIPFHEYFHGDSGRGVGASHQTGWTAVVANLLQPTK